MHSHDHSQILSSVQFYVINEVLATLVFLDFVLCIGECIDTNQHFVFKNNQAVLFGTDDQIAQI